MSIEPDKSLEKLMCAFNHYTTNNRHKQIAIAVSTGTHKPCLRKLPKGHTAFEILERLCPRIRNIGIYTILETFHTEKFLRLQCF